MHCAHLLVDLNNRWGGSIAMVQCRVGLLVSLRTASDRAHLLLDLEQEIDGLREAELAGTGKQIGTTKRGIGPGEGGLAGTGIYIHYTRVYTLHTPVGGRGCL